MPLIKATTSLALTEEKKRELKEDFGKLIEIIPGKTEKWLMVAVDDGVYTAFAGEDSSPALMVEVDLLGAASTEVYASLTEAICKRMQERLNIDGTRIYVKYKEFSVWGWNGINF
jgi:hypothetical protein